MPVVALTGATGFIGRALVARLCVSEPLPASGESGASVQAEGVELRALVRGSGRLNESDAGELREIDGSLDDEYALAELVRGADAVVHLAGAIAGSSAQEFDTVNVEGTRHLARAIESHAPGAHAVLVSSLAATRPALSWYAASKAGAEAVWAERLGRRISVLRPPAVYGPGDPALAELWRGLARGWLVRLGPADARFSMIHVDDLVEALVRLIAHGPTGATMTLAGPQPADGWTWPALARTAEAVRGAHVRTLPLPRLALAGLGRTALAVSRLRGRRALLSPGKVRELRHVDWVCDNLALSAHLNWTPARRLDEALTTLPGWTSQ